MRETGHREISDSDLKLIFPSTKTSFKSFVKKFLNPDDDVTSAFFNERLLDEEIVMRKIDKISQPLERKLGYFIASIVSLAKEEEAFKDTLTVRRKDFNLLKMFLIINFNNEAGVYPEDIKRLFTINQMTIDIERIEKILFGNKEAALSLQEFTKIFTKRGK